MTDNPRILRSAERSRHVGKADGSIMGCNPGAKATSSFHPTLGHFEMIASRPKRKRCSTRPNRSCNSLLRRTWSFQPFRLYRDGHGNNLARPRTERNAFMPATSVSPSRCWPKTCSWSSATQWKRMILSYRSSVYALRRPPRRKSVYRFVHRNIARLT